MAYCANCGVHIADDARYCTLCGTPTGRGADDPSAVAADPTALAPEVPGPVVPVGPPPEEVSAPGPVAPPDGPPDGPPDEPPDGPADDPADDPGPERSSPEPDLSAFEPRPIVTGPPRPRVAPVAPPSGGPVRTPGPPLSTGMIVAIAVTAILAMAVMAGAALLLLRRRPASGDRVSPAALVATSAPAAADETAAPDPAAANASKPIKDMSGSSRREKDWRKPLMAAARELIVVEHDFLVWQMYTQGDSALGDIQEVTSARVPGDRHVVAWRKDGGQWVATEHWPFVGADRAEILTAADYLSDAIAGRIEWGSKPLPSVTDESGGSACYIERVFTSKGIDFVQVDYLDVDTGSDGTGFRISNPDAELRTFVLPEDARIAGNDIAVSLYGGSARPSDPAVGHVIKPADFRRVVSWSSYRHTVWDVEVADGAVTSIIEGSFP